MAHTIFNTIVQDLVDVDDEQVNAIAGLVGLKFKDHSVPHIVAQVLDEAEVFQRIVKVRKEQYNDRIALRVSCAAATHCPLSPSSCLLSICG